MENNKKGLNKTTFIIGIMIKIQEYIAGIISVIGLYLILVWLSLFEYTSKLQEMFPNRDSLLFFGLVFFYLFLLFRILLFLLNIDFHIG